MPPARAQASRAPMTAWRDWRAWPESLATLWRRSLRFRTLLITVTLTMLAILIAGVTMALAIQNDLFESRKNEVLIDARRAVATAQQTLDATEVQGDRTRLQQTMSTVRDQMARQSSSDRIALFRIDSTPNPLAPQDIFSGALTEQFVPDELSAQVQRDPELQWWQSVALPVGDGRTVPGILVGQQLQFPGAGVGAYEVYLAYDLAAADETLFFVQRTLWLVGSVLVLLVAAIAWFILRSVATPITEAADTSARLAAGELKVRLPVRGEDELATLGRSFNAMADSIETQIKELAELSLVQQRFVSDVSHELRTPLTTIRLAADMLNDRRDDFDPATARAAELLQTQVQRFEVLLTDLLEISRYDAGSVQLELEPTSLASLAEDVVESMHQLAEQHGTDVRIVAPGGYSPVEMDAAARAPRRAQPSGQRHRARRGAADRRHRRQQSARRRNRGARLRPGDDAGGRRAGVRPVLEGRSVEAAVHRRHRPRPLHLARRCPSARRDAGRVVGARARDELRPHPSPAVPGARRRLADPARAAGCRARGPGDDAADPGADGSRRHRQGR